MVTRRPGKHIHVSDVRFNVAALCLSRGLIDQMDADWAEATGVYLLVGEPEPEPEHPNEWTVYVGKAGDRGFRSRIKEHQREKMGWSVAVLFRRDVTSWFNTSHQAWLERSLYGQLSESDRVRLTNKNRPSGDQNLDGPSAEVLENDILPLIFATLDLLGYDLDVPEAGGPKPRNPSQQSLRQQPPRESTTGKHRWSASGGLAIPSANVRDEILATLRGAESGPLQQVAIGLQAQETFAQMVTEGRTKNANQARNVVEEIRVMTGELRELSPSQRVNVCARVRGLLSRHRWSEDTSSWLNALAGDLG